MTHILIGTICFLIGGLIGVVIMACCAAAGFAEDVDRWVEGEKK